MRATTAAVTAALLVPAAALGTPLPWRVAKRAVTAHARSGLEPGETYATRCHRRTPRRVDCLITYENASEPFTFDDTGTARGEVFERVRVAYRHGKLRVCSDLYESRGCP